MANKNILYDSCTVKRKLPVNFRKEDRSIFAHELEKKLPPSYLYNFKDVSVSHLSVAFRRLSVIKSSLKSYKDKPRFNYKYFIKQRLQCNALHIEQPVLLFFNEWSAGYFHWVCDALPRLYAVQNKLNEAVVYMPDSFDMPFITDSLSLFDVKPVFFNKKQYIKATELLMPSMIAPSGNYHDSNLNACADYTIQQAKKQPGYTRTGAKVIFASRRYAERRKVLNEDELEKALAAYNVEFICFEDLSFAEAVLVANSASLIIGLHGAALTNALFLNPGAALLEIRFQNDTHNNCYFSLASSRKLQYYYHLTPPIGSRDTLTANARINVEEFMHTFQAILQAI